MKKKKVIFITTLIFFLILSYLFIYTGDDWAWGSEIGLERLSTFFHNYNSRYLGNLLVLILTRSNIIKAITIGFTLFLLVLLLYQVNNKRKDLYLLSLILILNIPKLIFKESISWTSGFSNYATSTLFTLIYLYYIRNIQSKELDNKLSFKTIILFILGLISNLFIEHNTIYNIILSIFIIFYYHYKYKYYNKNLISYFGGSFIGFLIMFLNLSSSTSGNRSLSTNILDIVINICNNYFGIIYEELIYHNLIINILLMIFITIMFIKRQNNNKIIKISYLINLSYIIYSIINIIYSIINIIYPSWNILLDYTPHFEGIFTFVYGLSSFYLLYKLINNKKLRNRISFYIISIVIVTIPLLFVSPIGSRCFLVTYTLFCLIILELYNYLIKDKDIINLVLITSIIISSIYLLSIYLTTYIENINRLNSINNQIVAGNKTIEIERFTYEDYIHGEGTPTPNTIWEERYKKFYNLDEELKITVKNNNS